MTLGMADAPVGTQLKAMTTSPQEYTISHTLDREGYGPRSLYFSQGWLSTSPVLCWPYICYCCCCEILIARAMSCPEDDISQPFSFSVGQTSFLSPLLGCSLNFTEIGISLLFRPDRLTLPYSQCQEQSCVSVHHCSL